MIIKEGIQDKIDKILLRKTMATAMDDTPQDEQLYSNSPLPEDDPNKLFEQRFSFRRTSELPPPIPSKEGVTTLNRGNTGTKPKIPLVATPMVANPRITSNRDWGKDSSFDSSSTKDETNVQVGGSIGSYSETLLLHDSLKALSVKESTQEAANAMCRFVLHYLNFSVINSITMFVMS